jgi:hypothetical protein
MTEEFSISKISRFDTDHTNYKIVFIENECRDLPMIRKIVYDRKPHTTDNMYFPSQINALIRLYDYNSISHSSKSFLCYILQRASKRYHYKTQVGYSLPHVLHHCVTIGVCDRSSFPRDDQGSYSPSKRCIQEAFIQAILRNTFSLYANIDQDCRQFELSIENELPIIATLDIDFMNLKTSSSPVSPILQTPFLQKKRCMISTCLKRRPTTENSYDTFHLGVTVLIIGYDREKKVFFVQHFQKPLTQIITISYVHISNRRIMKEAYVLVPSKKMTICSDSFKIIDLLQESYGSSSQHGDVTLPSPISSISYHHRIYGTRTKS